MLDNLNISFEYNNLKYSMSQTDSFSQEDVVYDIAEMTKQLIHFSDANPNIIIKELIEEFGYDDKEDNQ